MYGKNTAKSVGIRPIGACPPAHNWAAIRGNRLAEKLSQASELFIERFLVIASFLAYDQAMRFLAVITLALLVLTGCQTYAAWTPPVWTPPVPYFLAPTEKNYLLCFFALKPVPYPAVWNTDPKIRQKVEEAKRRGLTEQRCARLTNRPPAQQIAAVHSPAVPKAKPAFTPDYNAGKAADRRHDYAAELKRIRSLAEQGHAKAQNWLGNQYRWGWGVTKDYKEAVRWWRKAAKQGHAEAQRTVASLEKPGVTQARAEAARWRRKAAEQGHPASVGRLPGVTKEAARWYRIAAKQGHAKAQLILGKMYRWGWGVDQGPIKPTREDKWRICH